MKAVELFALALQDIKNNGASGRNASYQKFEAFATLIWVSNTFYDIAPEEEINSLVNFDKNLEAMRFQFPELNNQNTALDDNCIELREQRACMLIISGV